MKTVKVLHNQSILDISIQHTGSADNAFTIALLNGKSVSDFLIPGEDIQVPVANMRKDVFNHYTSKRIKPATNFNTEIIDIEPLAGIGYWVIGENFIIQ